MRLNPQSPAIVGGMSAEAYDFQARSQFEQTMKELGISDKQIVIPSFNTTSKLFAQHFHILRELKYRIDRLKQAYDDQRSGTRSWEQIDEVRKILTRAVYYLDFPKDQEISDNMI